MKTWYLLYDGSSPDGRGKGEYAGRTEDPEKALAHFKKVKSSPYSTGKVMIITDNEEKIAWSKSDFPN